jgi:hypothetical protein
VQDLKAVGLDVHLEAPDVLQFTHSGFPRDYRIGHLASDLSECNPMWVSMHEHLRVNLEPLAKTLLRKLITERRKKWPKGYPDPGGNGRTEEQAVAPKTPISVESNGEPSPKSPEQPATPKTLAVNPQRSPGENRQAGVADAGHVGRNGQAAPGQVGGSPRQQLKILARLHNMGYNVIPVWGKRPGAVKWKPYQTQRIRMEDHQRWHQDFSGQDRILNWALLTGRKPYTDALAVVVLDADDQEAEELLLSRCPETPAKVRSGRGGNAMHRYYRRPDNVDYLPGWAKIKIGGKLYNLDLRADAGYVLIPGSIHPKTGAVYKELAPLTPELIASLPVYDPSWLPDERQQGQEPRPGPVRVEDYDFEDDDFLEENFEDITVSVDDRQRQAQAYINKVPGTTQGDGADRDCYSLTMRLLWGFALPPSVAFELLYEWGQKDDNVNTVGAPYPWSEEEIRRKVCWAMNDVYRGEVGDKLRPRNRSPPRPRSPPRNNRKRLAAWLRR